MKYFVSLWLALVFSNFADAAPVLSKVYLVTVSPQNFSSAEMASLLNEFKIIKFKKSEYGRNLGGAYNYQVALPSDDAPLFLRKLLVKGPFIAEQINVRIRPRPHYMYFSIWIEDTRLTQLRNQSNLASVFQFTKREDPGFRDLKGRWEGDYKVTEVNEREFVDILTDRLPKGQMKIDLRQYNDRNEKIKLILSRNQNGNSSFLERAADRDITIEILTQVEKAADYQNLVNSLCEKFYCRKSQRKTESIQYYELDRTRIMDFLYEARSAGILDIYSHREKLSLAKIRVLLKVVAPSFMAEPSQNVTENLTKMAETRKVASAETIETKVELPGIDSWKYEAEVGSGILFFSYDQNISNLSDKTSFSAFAVPSLSLQAAVKPNDKWSAKVAYHNTPLKIKNKSGIAINKIEFNWTTTSIEISRYMSSKIFWADRWYLEGGIQSHEMPFLFLKSDDTVDTKSITANYASLGIGVEKNLTEHLMFEGYMRYQHLFQLATSSASSISASKQFSFDGSLGVPYQFRSNTRLGIYWYGQYHSQTIKISDGLDSNTADQSLLYSSLQGRMSFEF